MFNTVAEAVEKVGADTSIIFVPPAFAADAIMEAADAGVRVNAVAPSFASHPFLEKVSDPLLLEELEAQEPFGRGAQPWEIANIIVFLASDLSSYMTGECVSASSQHP